MEPLPRSPADVDLERGHDANDRDHTKRHYIQDFTFRFVPLCISILVVFSDGAILVCTLAFDKPLPRQGVVVVSVMLAVFFALFGLGGMCFHHQRRYAKRHRRGPNGLGGPPPGSVPSSYSAPRHRLRNLASRTTGAFKRLHGSVSNFMNTKPGERKEEEAASPRERDRPVRERPPPRRTSASDVLTEKHPSPAQYVSLPFIQHVYDSRSILKKKNVECIPTQYFSR